MRLSRRALVATVAAIATAGALAACGDDSPGGDGATGTITYFTFSAAPDHLEDLDAIRVAFEAENPGIKVEVRTAAYADYFTALQTQIAGNTAPDTFELNYENFFTYARNDALLALDDLAAGDADYDASRVYPKALAAFQVDGTQYAMPSTFSDVVLIYNKKLFDAAGLDYPTDSWTWEDEQAAAERLTDRAAGVYGNYQPVSFYEFYKALGQNGGSFLSADGKTATFNDAKGVEAAQWLINKPGTVMPTVAEIGGVADFDTALFKSGKLAMWHNGIWQLGGLNETAGLDYDIVVEPGNVRKNNAVFMNATAVSASTSKPAAAWKWARYLASSEQTVQTRLASSWELPAVNDQAAFDSYLALPPANRAAVFQALDAIALPPVIGDQQAQMQDTVTAELEKAANGEKSVQQALDDAAAAVTSLIAT
jgi:multiple sugar transport system substrate-binding protein